MRIAKKVIKSGILPQIQFFGKTESGGSGHPGFSTLDLQGTALALAPAIILYYFTDEWGGCSRKAFMDRPRSSMAAS